MMPRGTRHAITGILLDGRVFPILRVDGGGQWRLDLPSKYRGLIGRRVTVEGTRSGFDLLDVTHIAEADRR